MANVTNRELSEQLANLPDAIAAALATAQHETEGRFTIHRPEATAKVRVLADIPKVKLGQPTLAHVIARKYKALPQEGQYVNYYGQACKSTWTGSAHENKIYRHRNKLCWCNRGNPGRCHAVSRYGEGMDTWGIELG